MYRQTSEKKSVARKEITKPISVAQSKDGLNNHGNEKDEDELELDRLVLGDEAGFFAQLHQEEEDDDEEADSEAELEAQLGLDEGGQNLEGVDDADLFFLDEAPSALNENALAQRTGLDDGLSQNEEVPLWEDSDDERLMISLASNTRLRKLRVNEAEDMVSGREYARRLRWQFERLNPVPEWATTSARPVKRRRRSSAASDSANSVNSEDEMEIDDGDLSTLPLAQLLQSAGSLTRIATTNKRGKLRPEVIGIQRSRDIPMVQPSTIASLSFHPEYPILLSSGPAATLYLHHISPDALPTPHPLVTSVHITSTPLYTSAFLGPNGDKIFFSGRKPYFHTWDLESGTIQRINRASGRKEEERSMERFKLSPCGRYMGLVSSARKGGGIVNILNASTCQWIAAVRIEGRGGIADFAWWSDGEGLTIASKGGDVGEWSMENRSFITMWQDEGSFGTSVLALGGRSGRSELGGDRWVAIGSSSGIVNIYDRRVWVEDGISVPEHPEPTKTFKQLTTPTSSLVFSRDGQILAMSSRWKMDALRLIHLPSCTVYRNWPARNTPCGRVSAVAFSNESDLLAVANEQGKIRLWEIRP